MFKLTSAALFVTVLLAGCADTLEDVQKAADSGDTLQLLQFVRHKNPAL